MTETDNFTMCAFTYITAHGQNSSFINPLNTELQKLFSELKNKYYNFLPAGSNACTLYTAVAGLPGSRLGNFRTWKDSVYKMLTEFSNTKICETTLNEDEGRLACTGFRNFANKISLDAMSQTTPEILIETERRRRESQTTQVKTHLPDEAAIEAAELVLDITKSQDLYTPLSDSRQQVLIFSGKRSLDVITNADKFVDFIVSKSPSVNKDGLFEEAKRLTFERQIPNELLIAFNESNRDNYSVMCPMLFVYCFEGKTVKIVNNGKNISLNELVDWVDCKKYLMMCDNETGDYRPLVNPDYSSDVDPDIANLMLVLKQILIESNQYTRELFLGDKNKINISLVKLMDISSGHVFKNFDIIEATTIFRGNIVDDMRWLYIEEMPSDVAGILVLLLMDFLKEIITKGVYNILGRFRQQDPSGTFTMNTNCLEILLSATLRLARVYAHCDVCTILDEDDNPIIDAVAEEGVTSTQLADDTNFVAKVEERNEKRKELKPLIPLKVSNSNSNSNSMTKLLPNVPDSSPRKRNGELLEENNPGKQGRTDAGGRPKIQTKKHKKTKNNRKTKNIRKTNKRLRHRKGQTMKNKRKN
uniref:Uncharacterized protein n=1 Tax=viral metagenome TaxID=1070528 RepID=A0A6C0I9G8_9ZZZZ